MIKRMRASVKMRATTFIDVNIRYLSNGINANIVLGDVDLNFQG